MAELTLPDNLKLKKPDAKSKLILPESLKPPKEKLPKDTKNLEEDKDTEDTNWFVSSLAGIASGALKIPEGFVSLGAELIDLGFDTNNAAKVEEFKRYQMSKKQL